jgi:hypothetical protein
LVVRAAGDVAATGRVGIGTFTPAADLHISTGVEPRIRLEQTGTSSTPPRTWEIHGTDSGFFIQDVIGTVNRPFFIRSGAPTESIVIAPNGNVGLKTFFPEGNLHIFGEATKDVFSGIGPAPSTGPALNFGYAGGSFGRGAGFFNVRPDAAAVAPNPSIRFATVNQQRMIITNAGRVGIGTLNPSQALEVQGNIRANGSFLSNGTTLNVPDYVFEPDYQLRPLTDLQTYIVKEKHLPDLPSAREIKQQGVNMSELQMQLLKKIEELTLYTIEQEKVIAKQNDRLTKQEQLLQQLAARLAGGKLRSARPIPHWNLSAVARMQSGGRILSCVLDSTEPVLSPSTSLTLRSG